MVTAKFSAIFMAAVTIFLLVLARPIVGIFTHDDAVLGYGVEGLRIIASGFIFYGVSMVFTQALNGAGDTKTPTRLNFFCFWIFQTPLAYLLVKQTSMGTAGVMIAIPAAHALMSAVAWYVFKKGKWRDVKV